MGVHEAGGLRWAGNVGTGFADREIERLPALLEPLERSDSPLAELRRCHAFVASDVVWVEPKLVAEVEFAEWTHEGRLRRPSYLRLRDDKAASEVRRERAAVPDVVTAQGPGASALEPRQAVLAGGGDHEGRPHRLLPRRRRGARPAPPGAAVHDEALSRRLAGQALLPEAGALAHAVVDRAGAVSRPRPARASRRIIDYALVNDELALLWMANMGCIDLHTWASRVDRPERPDWVMFDLDPSEDSGFEEVIEVARLVKQTLDLLELESFPKTSGSRGIHVLVPIARRHSFADVREFAGIVAGALARAHPGLVTTEWAKQKRRGVLVDANQNGPGKTNASVYSVRPRAGAPVSTPLRWEEVVPGLDPAAFTMEAVLDRVARDGDLFAGVLGGKQSLKTALKALR